ncbi:MAG: hypothetical protein HYS36_03540 [Candidatus Rokubacteria bacterium]|nr:hypothetical protein [Candidatus Rokubacteria bacterium]MBI2526350.1 hypothetical protein [Candidatus Rokubacteria bacterium]
MHRTQLLLPRDLHRRAAQAAKVRGMSLGNRVREALGEYLVRAGRVQPSPEAIDEVLLVEPFEDPDSDPELSMNVDQYLYGAPRRSRRRQ